MMARGSRHTAAKSTQCLLLARRVNFLVSENVMILTVTFYIDMHYLRKLALCTSNLYNQSPNPMDISELLQQPKL